MIVLDSSFLIAGLLPEARTAFVRSVLASTAGEHHAPMLLTFEILHVVSRKQRRREISLLERDRALRDFAAQLIEFDARPSAATMQRIVSFADGQHLSGYDAAYLELAIRLDAELATLDGDLAQAGRQVGLKVRHTS